MFHKLKDLQSEVGKTLDSAKKSVLDASDEFSRKGKDKIQQLVEDSKELVQELGIATPVENLSINPLAIKNLKANNFHFLEQLKFKSDEELLSIKYINVKTLERIRLLAGQRTHIEKLKLPESTISSLKQSGFHYIENLRDKSDEDILSLENVNKASLDKIKEFLYK